MEKKKLFWSLTIGFMILCIGIIGSFAIISFKQESKSTTSKLEATVLQVDNNSLTIMDSDSGIYTVNNPNIGNIEAGDYLLIEYSGIFDKETEKQNIEVVNYTKVNAEADINGIPDAWKDDGIFSDYYVMAYNKLKTLSLDEKIGQLLLVRYPDTNIDEDLKKYKFSGFVFYEKDFRNKTEQEVQRMLQHLQSISNIPLLTAVDEEGGSVVRVSSNPKLADTPFKSPQELYDLGGFTAIKDDTIEKSKLLSNLGLNLNLAPVVDVSTDPSDYIYPRTLGKDTSLTSTYAKTVIEASKDTKVSYTLKHFPGYGNNADTHAGISVDNRTYSEILNNDIPPFKAGIEVGAEAVLVSHNIVNSIDSYNPASLSASVHNMLRNTLDFTGVIITDDISMGALDSVTNPTLKSVLVGNNLIITTDYETSFNEIKNAIIDCTIDESAIDKLAFKVLAWKYYKGLMLTTK